MVTAASKFEVVQLCQSGITVSDPQGLVVCIYFAKKSETARFRFYLKR